MRCGRSLASLVSLARPRSTREATVSPSHAPGPLAVAALACDGLASGRHDLERPLMESG